MNILRGGDPFPDPSFGDGFRSFAPDQVAAAGRYLTSVDVASLIPLFGRPEVAGLYPTNRDWSRHPDIVEERYNALRDFVVAVADQGEYCICWVE